MRESRALNLLAPNFVCGQNVLCQDDDKDVAAISDTVVPNREWVLATYAQNDIRKYKRISQTVVVGNYCVCCHVHVSMLFRLINSP